MLTLDFAKKISGNKCCDYNDICYRALNVAIDVLEKKYDYSEEFSNEMKIKAYKYILSQIAILHNENKELLDYDWEKEFTEDEVTAQLDSCRYYYLHICKEEPKWLEHYDFNEEYNVFINEDGQVVSDDEFMESEDFRDFALTDLIEEYQNQHPNGHHINSRLSNLTFKCNQAVALINDKLEFRKQILAQDNNVRTDPSLSDLLIKDRVEALRFIDDELRMCSRPQGKLIAMMIIVLCEKGYLPHFSGRLTEIYSAFKQLYPDKVGTPRGIEDYIRGYYKPSDNNPKTISNNELDILKNKLL